MRLAPLKSLTTIVFPDGLLLLLALAFLRPTGLPTWTGPLVLTYDYVVLCAAVLLAWYIGLSRVVFATLWLVVADGALGPLVSIANLEPDARQTAFQAVALLLPLKFLALALIRERARLVRRELLWLSLILAQAMLIFSVCRSPKAGWVEAVSAALGFAFTDPRWTQWTRLPQPSVLAFAAALALMTIRFCTWGGRLDRGFAWALVAVLLALEGAGRGWSPTNFLATAGLILIVALYADEYRVSHYDELTGLGDREALRSVLSTLSGRYALAVVDVDELKRINAHYRESVGNRALRVVAECVAGVRGGEVFRDEGDRFVIVFRGRRLTDVLPRLEALRVAVQGPRSACPGAGVSEERSPLEMPLGKAARWP
ncbi:diguanylate cyclase domain-containing protein [Candidatus Nitrospira bockiana]